MVDGAASLMSMFYAMKHIGVWSADRSDNLLDGGAHFYDTYECADGKWIAVGAIRDDGILPVVSRTPTGSIAPATR